MRRARCVYGCAALLCRGSGRSGFTLVEVLISTLVIGIGSLSLLVLFAGAARQQQLSAVQTSVLFESENSAGVLGPRLGAVEMNTVASDAVDNFSMENGEWVLVPSAAPGSLVQIQQNEALLHDGLPFDRVSDFFLSSAPHWMLVPEPATLTLLEPGNVYSNSTREYDPATDFGDLPNSINFADPLEAATTPIRPFPHNAIDAKSLDGSIVLVIDKYDTSGTDDVLLSRHEVPTRLIREIVLDDSALEQSGRTVRVGEFGLDGVEYPFLPELRYTNGSTRYETEPRFRVVLEARPEDDAPVASFGVTAGSGGLIGISGTDIYGPGERLRLGNVGPVFNAASLEPGLAFLDPAWPTGVVERLDPAVANADIEYRLTRIEVRGYVYRSDRLIGLNERVIRAEPDAQWASGRPERAYSVLYRMNSDGSSQFATFMYNVSAQTRNTIVSDQDTIDFLPVDYAPRAGEIENGVTLDVGRRNSPIVTVDLLLGLDAGRGQYYVEVIGESSALGDGDWLMQPGIPMLMNVYPTESLADLGVRARGVDGVMTIESVIDIGGRQRAYLDDVPTVYGRPLITLNDNLTGGGLVIPQGGSLETMRVTALVVNGGAAELSAFPGEPALSNVENLNGDPLLPSRWTLEPEAIRIFQVTR